MIHIALWHTVSINPSSSPSSPPFYCSQLNDTHTSNLRIDSHLHDAFECLLLLFCGRQHILIPRPHMASPSNQLQPPYPLTHLERRALERGDWTLVWNQADERVYFFNPTTRQATRHLQPVLLLSAGGSTAGGFPSKNNIGSSNQHHHNTAAVPIGAALPPVPPADSVESLRASLEQKSRELATADSLIRLLQQENLLIRYAVLSQPSSSKSQLTLSTYNNNATAQSPLLLCSRCQHTEVSASMTLPSSLHAMSSDALNVLIASPLKTLNIQPVAHTPAATEERTSYPLLSHTPLTIDPRALAAVGTSPVSGGAHPSPSRTPTSQSQQEALQDRIRMLEKQLQSLTTVHLELLSHVQLQR